MNYGSTCEKTRNRARALACKHVSVEGKVCERCGKAGYLHRHHADYNKPLEVELLCRKCHCAEHKRPYVPHPRIEARRQAWSTFYKRYADGLIDIRQVQAFARANRTTTEHLWKEFRIVYGRLADYRQQVSA